MVESSEGYSRPQRGEGGNVVTDAARVFTSVCPGVTVSANPAVGTLRHPTMGAYVAVWKAWATDPEIRFRGSSGGVLTALSGWLLESGKASRVTGAQAAADARRSVSVTITTRAEALEASGSRYTPVSSIANPDVLLPGTVVVCKPCEASALKSLVRSQGSVADEEPLSMSFFCAGTPSAQATDRLTEDLGIPLKSHVDELWYRGHGWPGQFSARSGEIVVSTDYDDSWGKNLGPTTQWRCKMCPDGVGESADIVAADFWGADERGYPLFVEGDGVSALVARNDRGLAVILEASAAGVIQLERIEMDSLASVQPLQRERRRFLAARMLGSLLGGRRAPKYRGFGLIRLALADPRTALTVLRGTYRRVSRAKAVSKAARK
jgi:coenzyme F420 hydrogenase subunit beta